MTQGKRLKAHGCRTLRELIAAPAPAAPNISRREHVVHCRTLAFNGPSVSSVRSRLEHATVLPRILRQKPCYGSARLLNRIPTTRYACIRSLIESVRQLSQSLQWALHAAQYGNVKATGADRRFIPKAVTLSWISSVTLSPDQLDICACGVARMRSAIEPHASKSLMCSRSSLQIPARDLRLNLVPIVEKRVTTDHNFRSGYYNSLITHRPR